MTDTREHRATGEYQGAGDFLEGLLSSAVEAYWLADVAHQTGDEEACRYALAEIRDRFYDVIRQWPDLLHVHGERPSTLEPPIPIGEVPSMTIPSTSMPPPSYPIPSVTSSQSSLYAQTTQLTSSMTADPSFRAHSVTVATPVPVPSTADDIISSSSLLTPLHTGGVTRASHTPFSSSMVPSPTIVTPLAPVTTTSSPTPPSYTMTPSASTVTPLAPAIIDSFHVPPLSTMIFSASTLTPPAPIIIDYFPTPPLFGTIPSTLIATPPATDITHVSPTPPSSSVIHSTIAPTAAHGTTSYHDDHGVITQDTHVQDEVHVDAPSVGRGRGRGGPQGRGTVRGRDSGASDEAVSQIPSLVGALPEVSHQTCITESVEGLTQAGERAAQTVERQIDIVYVSKRPKRERHSRVCGTGGKLH